MTDLPDERPAVPGPWLVNRRLALASGGAVAIGAALAGCTGDATPSPEDGDLPE